MKRNMYYNTCSEIHAVNLTNLKVGYIVSLVRYREYMIIGDSDYALQISEVPQNSDLSKLSCGGLRLTRASCYSFSSSSLFSIIFVKGLEVAGPKTKLSMD